MKLRVLILLLLSVTCAKAQETPSSDFLRADIVIQIDTNSRCIGGQADYMFHVIDKTDSVILDAKSMTFSKVLINGRKAPYKNTGKQIRILKNFKAGKQYKLLLEYQTCPMQTVYFTGWDDPLPENNQIWTQGQGKYTSHWVPSFDSMQEKLEFDLSITFDKSYAVASNGELISCTEQGRVKTWKFNMEKPMSSYLLAFAIGKYRYDSIISTSGVPIELYYLPGDSSKVEPTYRHSRQIFDFLEKKIGLDYPWQNYRQVPVREFLYAGMENTGCTIFSDAYMVDSTAFKDRNYVNINAHELAHQWFGNLVTELSGRDHWLHEGFATYYAYLAEKELFGEEYFYWKLYDTARALDQMSAEGGGEALTDPNAGSLTFYEKGAWALYMLHEEVGTEAFDSAILDYLIKYSYRNATVENFMDIMESRSGSNLDAFNRKWLKDTDFPFDDAIKRLTSACTSLENFRALKMELTASKLPNQQIIEEFWDQNSSSHWREAVIKTYFKSLTPTFIKKAIETGDLKVRQAIAHETIQIPSELKSLYESLLADESYLTKEAALYKLWIYFDDDRETYLEQCRNHFGLPNRNLRLLWLTLAILTPGFEEDLKPTYFAELSQYTSSQYNFETRQLAFQYLKEAFYFTDENLRDLMTSTVHHSWQFRNYARQMLDELLAKEQYRVRIKHLMKELKEQELRYIKTKLAAE